MSHCRTVQLITIKSRLTQCINLILKRDQSLSQELNEKVPCQEDTHKIPSCKICQNAKAKKCALCKTKMQTDEKNTTD